MSETDTMVANTNTRPKSKKELRAERKAAKKLAAASTSLNRVPKQVQLPTEDEIKAEKHRLKKELRKEKLKEREKEMIKEMRREKKLRQQKRKRRELHAVGGGINPQQAAERLKERRNMKKQKRERDATQEATSESKEMAVFDRVFNGVGGEDEEGTRVLEMGVKATDVVIGKGQTVQNNSLVTVRYKLTGGKFGALIDSNNKFVFRVGKLEVIQGWDIGVLGMKVGGTRKLVVPPKAGYGSKDIGAGPGELLYFDITMLSCT